MKKNVATSLFVLATIALLGLSSASADPNNKSLEIYAVGGNIKVISLDVYELKSAWPETNRSQSP
jgi:hypothetical protein